MPSLERQQQLRAELQVSSTAPLLLYPGDLEVSAGAQTVLRIASSLCEREPELTFVIAYRDKTQEAAARARVLSEGLAPELRSRVRFCENVADIHALLAAATSVVFPVDDLYGKVDLPIVLLEALALGTPVLALDAGPLASLDGALRLPADDSLWIEACQRLVRDPAHRAEVAAMGRRAVQTTYAPEVVARAYEQAYAELLAAAGQGPGEAGFCR
jgi:phosphatidylinositol alpha-1,6-mannosyltransferase